MPGGWKTPRGARPNRRGEPARLDERLARGSMLPQRWRKPSPGPPSGRLLESRREARPRGMIAAACRPFHGRMGHRIRLTGPAAKVSFLQDDAILPTPID